MKHLPTFDQFLIEGFVKAYGDKMNPEEFKAIEVGSEVLYSGNRYKVDKNVQFLPINGINNFNLRLIYNKTAGYQYSIAPSFRINKK